MKYLIAASIILSVVAFKPADQLAYKHNNFTVAGEQDSTASLEGKWKLMPVLASDTAAGKIPFINFNIKSGKFSGNTGCNNMSGNFMVKQGALQFGEHVLSTKMACAGYNEKAFLDNLLKTNSYKIENGVLQLMYNTTILSKWVRHNDATATKQI